MTPAAIALTSRIRHLAVPGYGDDEVAFIADTIAELKPTHIFDWGTNVGGSARVFWEAAPHAIITTVEHPDEQTHDHPGGRYGLWCEGLGPRMRMLMGDGVTEALKEYEAEGRPERVLFFLDGDHSFDAVGRELTLIAANAPSAWMLIHDTAHPVEEVEAAIEDFLGWPPSRDVYESKWLNSQAGMARLWPRNRP